MYCTVCTCTVSPFILTLAGKLELGLNLLNLTADKLSVLGTVQGTECMSGFSGVDRYMGASALSPCLLQIPLYWDMEKFEVNVHSQTHLNKCQSFVTSYPCVYVCQFIPFKSQWQHLCSQFPLPQSYSPQFLGVSSVTCFLLSSAHVARTVSLYWEDSFQPPIFFKFS